MELIDQNFYSMDSRLFKCDLVEEKKLFIVSMFPNPMDTRFFLK